MKPVKDYGLAFHPKPGTLLVCDFRGFEVPEIVKRRPVIVFRDRLPYRPGLCMVVPTSTTAPLQPQAFHVRLSRNYVPNGQSELETWAKCDLVCSVSMKRLDRFKVAKRKYFAPCISDEDFEAICQGVRSALGF